MTDITEVKSRADMLPAAVNKVLKYLTTEIDRIKAEHEALRKDGERYRWFRDCGCGWNDVMVLDSHGRIICEELDDRIDAAIGREPGQ